MKCAFYVFIGCVLLALTGCRDAIYIGAERSTDSVSDDIDSSADTDAETMTSTIPDASTDSGVDSGTNSETVTAEDTGTGSDSGTDPDSGMDTGTDTGTETDTESGVDSDTGILCELPSEFYWTSSPPTVYPPLGTLGIKDPSVVFSEEAWHVYATVQFEDTLGLAYFSYTDFNDAGSAVQYLVSDNPNMTGYKAAPQLFYFEPKATWYLIFQTQAASYSTSPDPTNVQNWTEMVTIMPVPQFLLDEEGNSADYWIICDDAYCYMFFTAFNGTLYRTRTTIDDFPNNFGEVDIALQDTDDSGRLFEASSVYKIKGANQYLLLVSTIGGFWGRYSRAWTSDRLDGIWTPLADSEENAFVSVNKIEGADWSGGISHGEILRINRDQTMTIDPCNLQFMYSGGCEGYDFCLGLLQNVH